MKSPHKSFFLIFCCLLSLTATAQTRWNAQYQQYIDKWSGVAVEQMQRYKIPASITLAQGLLESGAGQSELARKGNNHFGIKCHNGWTGPTMYRDDDQRNDCFRVYGSARESYEDHSRFLSGGQRYRSLFSLKPTDYKGWARGLKAAGYATNPKYAQRLIDIIEVYKLYEYDNGRSGSLSTDDFGRTIFIFNDRLYIIARRGDTFRSLAEETGISRRKLAKYNERDKDDVLQDGEIVWLKKKARKAPKEYKNRPHVVQPGESMYSISQFYGIRLKNLYKMNDLSPDATIRVGDQLRLR
jgi:LysM repeat protein